MTETAQIEVRIPTPILDTINRTLSKLLHKNLAELTADTCQALERGVATDETARDADIVSEDSHKAVRTVQEIRLQYTRPIDEGKKNLMREVERLLRPLVEPLETLDKLRLERVAEIEAKKEEARRKAEAEQRAAEEAARKEEERRRNISLGKGGEGIFTPVEVSKPVQPIEQIGMRSTTRVASIPDNDAIENAINRGIRQIPGVHIYQVWKFDIVDSKKVPKEYRKLRRA